MRALGWEPGKNVELLYKSAESRYERMPDIVEQFVRMPVDVLVVFGPQAADAARQKTKTIPIVWAGSYELGPQARPEGNITGSSYITGPQGLKRLEILKALVPKATNVAIFTVSAKPSAEPFPASVVAAAKGIGLDIFRVTFASPAELERAYAEAKRRGANAVYLPVFPELTWSESVRAKVIQQAAQYRLPAAYEVPSLAASGGLLAYGADDTAGARRVPYFVDRILRGAKPSDLPIETISRIELNINRRTARELGLEIPPALLLQADNVFD
jgi:putative ABC transport system substrate-binding protein